MPHRLLDLAQVCAYLRMADGEVRKLVKRDEIPCLLKGERVMFRKRDVDAWASQRILSLDPQALGAFRDAAAEEEASIAGLMGRDWIEPGLASRTKAAVIRDMVGIADRSGRIYDSADLHDSLREREEIGSTALSGGVALLHPRHHEPYMFSESIVVLGKCVHPIPFGAPDGGMTDMFFLICSQYDQLHLRILSRLCLMMGKTELLPELREAEGAQGMYDAICAAERVVV
jgi:PTS system nitrogen regulatory IIA component